MKDWEKYEDQIFKKLNSEFSSAEILKNQKILGLFSKRRRQVDILVKSEIVGKKIICVLDCKKFSKRINLITIESFIGFLEDVGANIGIMITNVGYSTGAKNRITNYTRDIRLDIVEFENFDEYHFTLEFCDFCYTKEGVPRGEISWEEQETLIKDNKTTLISRGECPYCGESYIKCIGCGEIIHIDENMEDYECPCGNVFSFSREYIGQGMTETNVSLKI